MSEVPVVMLNLRLILKEEIFLKINNMLFFQSWSKDIYSLIHFLSIYIKYDNLNILKYDSSIRRISLKALYLNLNRSNFSVHNLNVNINLKRCRFNLRKDL